MSYSIFFKKPSTLTWRIHFRAWLCIKWGRGEGVWKQKVFFTLFDFQWFSREHIFLLKSHCLLVSEKMLASEIKALQQTRLVAIGGNSGFCGVLERTQKLPHRDKPTTHWKYKIFASPATPSEKYYRFPCHPFLIDILPHCSTFTPPTQLLCFAVPSAASPNNQILSFTHITSQI